MKIKPHLVIAKYNEDVSWVDARITEFFDVYVYNKGPNFNFRSKDLIKVIELKNIGRESHTYLLHILENYNSLPEKTIFTQAHPHDHVSQDFLPNFYNFIDSSEEFKYFSKNILEMRIEHDGVEESGILNGSLWKNKHSLESCCVTVPSSILLNIKLKKWVFGTGAIFGVGKKSILYNSKNFYQKCIDILEKSSNPVNPPEGHAFERSWYLIFNQ